MTAKATASAGGAVSPLARARTFLEAKVKDFKSIRVVLNHATLQNSLPHIPSGCDVIDHLVGGEPNSFGVAPCPGVPRGRVLQIWGHESAGKTTFALTVCAQAILAGGSVLYIDWENDIVPDYAAALGIPVTDSDKFELLQPETLEDGIKYAMVYAKAGADLIVFDSVGAAVPRRLREREGLEAAEQGKVGEAQAAWSQELPNLKSVIARSGTAVIGISQIRAKIGGMGNGPQTQPQGGNAWKFYSSVRLELRRVQNESAKEYNALTGKTEERVVGGIIKVKAVKCKMSRSQGREEIFYIRWGEGIDNIRSIMEIAIAHGVIKKSGSWLTWERPGADPVKVQGTEKLRTHLHNHWDDYQLLRGQVVPLIGGGAAGLFSNEIVMDDGTVFDEELDAMWEESVPGNPEHDKEDGDEELAD